MPDMHPGVFGNWAFVTDELGATIHSCIGFEPRATVVRNCRFLYYKRQLTGIGYLILPYLVIAVIGCSLNGFPYSLDTKAMGEYVIRHFTWDCCGIAFPPSPLPKDF